MKNDLFTIRCGCRPVSPPGSRKLRQAVRLQEYLNRAATYLLAFVWLVAATRAGAGSISGTVTDLGSGLAGVAVTAVSGAVSNTDYTAADGSYSMTVTGGPVPIGYPYLVTPSAAGYAFNPNFRIVGVILSQPVSGVDFSVGLSASTAPAVPLFTAASLVGAVNPHGNATFTWFEYGLTSALGSSTAVQPVGSGSTAVSVSNLVSGLQPETSYYFRVVATNASGRAEGARRTVFTGGLPAAETRSAVTAGPTSATLFGDVYQHGLATAFWFDYGTTTNYGSRTPGQNLPVGFGTLSVSNLVSSLQQFTTYHYRVVATNLAGTAAGGDEIITAGWFTDANAGLLGVMQGAAAWGDYDNDGDLDLLLTGDTAGSEDLRLYRNNGNGTFTAQFPALPDVYAGSVTFGDYDRDNDLDLLITGHSGTNRIARVYANTGAAGSFGFVQDADAVLTGVDNSAAVWVDAENDGDLDIFLIGATASSSTMRLTRNDGQGDFPSSTSYGAGLIDGSIAVGDYDNDGDFDLLLTGMDNVGALNSYIFRNNGAGSFSYVNAGLPGVYRSSAAWGDYDHDGDLDIVLAGSSTNGPITRVYRNTGGSFSDIGANLPGIYDGMVVWGDCDNDGDLDMLLAGATDSSTPISRVYRNNGNHTFSDVGAGLEPLSYATAAWADYDNDGDLDILLTGRLDIPATTRVSRLYRNNILNVNTPPSAPASLSMQVSNSVLNLQWNAAVDAQTPADGLTYNVRLGTTPGGSEIISPMSAGNGFRRVAAPGNGQHGLSARVIGLATDLPYYFSVQAVDASFIGSPFSTEMPFSLHLAAGPPSGLISGDTNGDGFVDEDELNAVLSNYFATSPWLYLTNVAGLGGTNVTFALTNSTAGAFSVEYTTNLMDWLFLGPAIPRYLITDTNAPAVPQRYYRLRWP